MADSCPTNLPLSSFYSTALNPVIKNYEQLATRIFTSLGYPLIKVELHFNQVMDAIAQSVEMFTEYAGYTEEYLIFSSTVYDRRVGIRMDQLFTHTPEMYQKFGKSMFTYNSNGDPIINQSTNLTNDQLSAYGNNDVEGQRAYWDYVLNNYRKVIDCFAFEIGTSTGVNTLFTIEQSIAQQSYFAYNLGNYGYDVVTLYALKEWLDLREKIFAQKPMFRFDKRKQLMTLLPPPNNQNQQYYGLVGCYVERPISEIICEKWVLEYARTLCEITLAKVRGNFEGVSLLGGGKKRYAEMESRAFTKKDELEKQLMEGSGGLASNSTMMPRFFVG